MNLISSVPPGLVLGLALVLALAQLSHSLLHHGRRPYPAVFLLAAAGVGAGQVWAALGLPALGIGEVNLVPAVAFAIVLQPLAKRLHLRLLP